MKRLVPFRKPLVKSSSIRDIPMQRSIVLYYSAIKSEQTKKTYTFVLNKFREYFIIKDYDSLVSIGSKKIQVMIEDYVLYLRSKNSSYGSVHNVICSLKLFFSMNDIVCNWVKINKMKPERKKLRGDKPYTTEDLRIVNKSIESMKIKGMDMSTGAGVWWKLDMEKIKKLLEK